MVHVIALSQGGASPDTFQPIQPGEQLPGFDGAAHLFHFKQEVDHGGTPEETRFDFLLFMAPSTHSKAHPHFPRIYNPVSRQKMDGGFLEKLNPTSGKH